MQLMLFEQKNKKRFVNARLLADLADENDESPWLDTRKNYDMQSMLFEQQQKKILLRARDIEDFTDEDYESQWLNIQKEYEEKAWQLEKPNQKRLLIAYKESGRLTDEDFESQIQELEQDMSIATWLLAFGQQDIKHSQIANDWREYKNGIEATIPPGLTWLHFNSQSKAFRVRDYQTKSSAADQVPQTNLRADHTLETRNNILSTARLSENAARLQILSTTYCIHTKEVCLYCLAMSPQMI